MFDDLPQENLSLAYYDEREGRWITLDCDLDTGNDCIESYVTHFTTFAVIGTIELQEEKQPVVVDDGSEEEDKAPVVEEEKPVVEEEKPAVEKSKESTIEKDEPVKKTNWALIGGIIAAVTVVVILSGYFLWYKRRSH